MEMTSCKIQIKKSATPLPYISRSNDWYICRYDFEYEDDGDEENGDIDIENKYYNAKQMKVSNPEEAIDEFLGVPALEQEKSEWGFKGLKQAIKLEFKLGRYEKVCFQSFNSFKTT